MARPTMPAPKTMMRATLSLPAQDVALPLLDSRVGVRLVARAHSAPRIVAPRATHPDAGGG